MIMCRGSAVAHLGSRQAHEILPSATPYGSYCQGCAVEIARALVARGEHVPATLVRAVLDRLAFERGRSSE